MLGGMLFVLINNKKRKTIIDIWSNKSAYLMILPALVVIIIFAYIPMYGVTLAFKEFKINLGVLNSPWIGFKKFELMFQNREFVKVIFNTVIISFGRILFEFPAPIILAILLNELRFGRYKKLLQTVYTFPNFLSWVIVAGIIKNFLRSDGFINELLKQVGLQPVSFLIVPALFKPILFATDLWKGMGWSAIIYLAAITSINPDLYDAAIVDGANRFKRIVHITLPGITGTITLLLILGVANTMNAGFDQIFNLINPVVKSSGEIIDTYIYDITFNKPPDLSFSTAVGLFKGLTNFILIMATDRIIRSFGGKGLYN